jgi:hypothetical protein
MLFTRARGKSRLGTGSPGLRLVWARRTGQVDPRPRRYKTGGSPASRDRSLWRCVAEQHRQPQITWAKGRAAL